MVKGEGGGAGCCAESERATTRRACKRTATQLMQDDAPLVLYVPCAMARGCGGEGLRGKGAGQAAVRGAKGRPRAGHANAPPRKTGMRRRTCCQCLGCTCPAQLRGGAGENG